MALTQQYESEIIDYVYDAARWTSTPAGVLISALATAAVTATPSGLTLGTPDVGTSSVKVRVAGGTAATNYNLVVAGTRADAVERRLVAALRIRPDTEALVEYTQRASEAIPYLFNWTVGCTVAGVVVDSLASVSMPGVSGLTFGSLTGSGLARTRLISGGVVGTRYVVAATATLTSGQVRRIVIGITIRADSAA